MTLLLSKTPIITPLTTSFVTRTTIRINLRSRRINRDVVVTDYYLISRGFGIIKGRMSNVTQLNSLVVQDWNVVAGAASSDVRTLKTFVTILRTE